MLKYHRRKWSFRTLAGWKFLGGNKYGAPEQRSEFAEVSHRFGEFPIAIRIVRAQLFHELSKCPARRKIRVGPLIESKPGLSLRCNRLADRCEDILSHEMVIEAAVRAFRPHRIRICGDE